MSELDLFSLPPTNVGVVQTRTVEVPPTNTLTDDSPIEFRIQNSRNFIDLKRTYLCLNFKIKMADGTDIPQSWKRPKVVGGKVEEEEVKELTVGPVQMIGCSVVKNFIFSINGVAIGDANGNQAYRSYFESEFLLPEEARKCQLQSAGYFLDDTFDTHKGKGHLARMEMCKLSKNVQVIAPLHIDMARQGRLLLPFLDIKLTVYLNSPDFFLESFDGSAANTFKFEILSAKLLVSEWELHEDVANSVEKMLLTGHPVQYPLSQTALRTVYIEEGRTTAPENVIWSSILPSRVLVALCETSALNGSISKSPFNFKHFDVSNIYLDVGGRTLPSRPFNLNYSAGHYLQAYTNTQEALGFARGNEDNGLTPDKWLNGRVLYAFEVSPGAQSEMFDVVKRGTTSLRIEFAKPVPKGGVVAVIMGEFPQCLTLDKDRRPFIDSII